MQKLKSFFDLEVGLAEVELPAEYRAHFIKWSKKLEKQDKYSEKLKASIEIKNNEYFLILEEEDQKQYKMNISDLQKPAQKCNLLIQAPPYIDANDLNKTISLMQYKATAKFENNQRDLDDLSRGIKNLNRRKYSNSSSDSDGLEVNEQIENQFDMPKPFNLAHQDFLNPQKLQNMNQQNQECDVQQLRMQLIDFLKSKGENGCTLQEIKKYSKFQDIADKQISEALKQISNPTKRQSKLYFSLNKTFLRQQKYIFGLKTTKFYYLEGTQFIIFEDDKTHIPEERIDLTGFIVDGIWQEDGYHTFILRNVQHEIIWQFFAMSYDDASEWVSKLKQAILISEYDQLINQNYPDKLESSSNYLQHNQQESNKNLPEFVQKQLKLYSEISKDKWVIEKTLKQMRLMSLTSQTNIVLKGEYVFNTSMQNLITILKKGEKFVDLFKQETNIHQIDQSTYHQDLWKFQHNNQVYQIESNFLQFDFQRANSFVLTRESVLDNTLPQFANLPIQQQQKKQKNTIHLFKILEIFHIVEEDTKCFMQYLYISKKDKNEAILKKFIKEQIINISIISTELDLLLIQINTSQIPITQSRLITVSEQYLDSHIKETENYCENIHFVPQDRLGYVDKELPTNHPAHIHQNMHNRLLHQNESQMQALNQLREKVAHIKLNDQTLIRFLIARNYKVNDAEQMILKCLKWRKENNINSRKIEDYKLYDNEKVNQKIGYSKWGHPILITNAMNSHPEKFETHKHEGFTEEGYLEFHQSFLEEAIRSMRGQVDQFLVLMDCYQLKTANFTFSVLKKSFHEIFNYYPERQFRIYVLNTNLLTRSFYQMLKHFLPSRTVEKITFVGQDFQEIKQALLRDLDEETIPARYGGKNMMIQ